MLLLPLLISPPLHAADVLVFGDSWAAGSADVLQEVLDAHGTGFTVEGYGIGGTTADQYANQYPDAIPTVLAEHPEARWIWLSMGGNDLFANYYAGNGANNAALYDTNFRAVLDQIKAVRPDIRVVSFGYDFVNFEQSTECIEIAWTYFGWGTLTPTVNGYFLDDVAASLEGIDPDYFRYDYVSKVWGTLQAAGGVTGAPDPNLPSPSKYMSDCIHPNAEGYTLIHEVLYEGYWGRTAPVAAIEGNTTVCVGETETWPHASIGEGERRWLLDGVSVGEDESVKATFDEPGTHSLWLLIGAGAWEDSAEMEINAEDCGGTDTGATDTGGPAEDTGPGGGGDSGAQDGGDDTASPPSGSPTQTESSCGCKGGSAAGLFFLGILGTLQRRRR